MPDSITTEKLLQDLFASQRLAVLGTCENGQPYASLVAFAVSADLRGLLFVTSRTTRKYRNLKADNRVSMLMDNRSNHIGDFSQGMAVTALGTAEELSSEERAAGLTLFLAKHPALQEFAASPSSALVRVGVRSYYLVRGFQDVREYHF